MNDSEKSLSNTAFRRRTVIITMNQAFELALAIISELSRSILRCLHIFLISKCAIWLHAARQLVLTEINCPRSLSSLPYRLCRIGFPTTSLTTTSLLSPIQGILMMRYISIGLIISTNTLRVVKKACGDSFLSTATGHILLE